MNSLRLAFLLPALLAVAPVRADGVRKPVPPAAAKATPMRYVTLDRLLHEFAAQARAQRDLQPSMLLARR